jgi:hypothetical protein
MATARTALPNGGTALRESGEPWRECLHRLRDAKAEWSYSLAVPTFRIDCRWGEAVAGNAGLFVAGKRFGEAKPSG